MNRNRLVELSNKYIKQKGWADDFERAMIIAGLVDYLIEEMRRDEEHVMDI